MKLLVTEDILWVVKPEDCGVTAFKGSRQIELQVFLLKGRRRRGFESLELVELVELVESRVLVKSRLRTSRPLRVTDFKDDFLDGSILIIV